MSGAIINFVYGIPLNLENLAMGDIEEEELNQITGYLHSVANNGCGVVKEYSAYGDGDPMYFGIELQAIYEGNNCGISFLQSKLTITEETENKFKELWTRLDDEVRAMITKHFGGSPFTFLLWSNS